MANDQEKTGQQGGTTQNNPDGFENDPHRPSEPGQRGGQLSESESDLPRDLHQGGQDLGGGYQSDHQGAVGAAHRGGMEVIPRGPSLTMAKAKLTKLRKRCRTKTAA